MIKYTVTSYDKSMFFFLIWIEKNWDMSSKNLWNIIFEILSTKKFMLTLVWSGEGSTPHKKNLQSLDLKKIIIKINGTLWNKKIYIFLFNSSVIHSYGRVILAPFWNCLYQFQVIFFLCNFPFRSLLVIQNIYMFILVKKKI